MVGVINQQNVVDVSEVVYNFAFLRKACQVVVF